jgi:hypothetical protein
MANSTWDRDGKLVAMASAMKRLLLVTAALEAAAGVALLVVPSMAAMLLLGAPVETSAALTVARVGGCGLFTLGMACWLARADAHSRAATGLVDALTFYNIAVVVVLAYAGVRLGLRGVLLWPAVVLHIAMAAWCIVRPR